MGTDRDSSEPDCRRQFHAAVTVIQSLPKNGSYRPSYEEMLRFYSYYKQATQGPCQAPRPGFWDPIGRYKWDAWHRLGKMTQEEAMMAYIAQMKVVAQKVIDTVPLSEVDDSTFDYFIPLYEMIPDMPQPPEIFLKKLTAQKKMPNGDLRTTLEPLPPPEEPAPPTSQVQLPRVPSNYGKASMDLDSEVFCDSLEQLDPEQGEWLQEELKGALEGETDISSDHLLSREREMVGRAPQGPQEFEAWLANTVQALQESMQEVQGRLRCLENQPRPTQKSPSQQGPWALELSTPMFLLLLLWPFVVQWLCRQFRRQKR